MGGASRAKSNWFKQRNPKNRNSKFVLKFDEDDRNEFLTGFQRRKKERREHAQKIAQEKQREEKLQARKERREAKKELLSNTELYFPNDIDSELKQKTKAEVYDHSQHTVTVTTITKVDLLSEHGGLGTNKVEYDEDEENEKDSSEEDSNCEGEERKKKKSALTKKKCQSSDITRQKFWMKLKTRKRELKKLSKSDPQAFSKSKQQQRRLLKKNGRRK